MRKNTPRKWIHAILDLLPLLVIPIFAIYSQRHDIDNNVVQREEPNLVNVTQGILNGKPNSDLNNWSFDNVASYEYENFLEEVFIRCFVDDEFEFNVGVNLSVNVGDKIIFFQDISFTDLNYVSSLDINFFGTDSSVRLNVNNFVIESKSYYYLTSNVSGTFVRLDYYGYNDYNDTSDPEIYLKDVQVFNLTSIFGSGNEPTGEQFYTWLNGRYIDFGTRTMEYGTKSVTYNETDIGSQFIYQMYNVTDKYFNFNRLFNMEDIYTWLNNNLFGGNAPLPVTIVWNIIVYEFFMDLIFLLYSFFMFVIDWSTSMIDKFLYNARK